PLCRCSSFAKIQLLIGINNIFVYAEAAGGVYTSTQLKLLAGFAEEDSLFIKVTEDQRIGFMISPEKTPDYQKKLAQAGLLLRDYRSANSLAPKACLGEMCPYSEQDALGDSIDLSSHLNEKHPELPHYLRASMNGCGRACVDSATDDISIIGENLGYKICIGGKNSEIPILGKFLIEQVSKEQLGEVVCKILEVYFAQRQDDEKLYDLVERIGTNPFLLNPPPVQDSEFASHDDILDNELNSSAELEKSDGDAIEPLEETEDTDPIEPLENSLADEDFSNAFDFSSNLNDEIEKDEDKKNERIT
ncbi:MAG: hypothetical protein K2X39_05775, partial [Silvanigrellaceae bacterium]|nr:hypothetical protein [Silvanigrellaceae bacterium]